MQLKKKEGERIRERHFEIKGEMEREGRGAGRRRNAIRGMGFGGGSRADVRLNLKSREEQGTKTEQQVEVARVRAREGRGGEGFPIASILLPTSIEWMTFLILLKRRRWFPSTSAPRFIFPRASASKWSGATAWRAWLRATPSVSASIEPAPASALASASDITQEASAADLSIL